MTPFEFISVPLSIVLALALGRVLSSTLALVDGRKRDWLHLLFCFILVVGGLNQWLLIWDFQMNESWSNAEFYLAMLSPILLYIGAAMLVPNDSADITSWSTHLDSVARPLMLVMGLIVVNVWLRSLVVLDKEIEWQQLVFLPLLIVQVVAFTFPRRWVIALSGICWVVIFTSSALSGGLDEPTLAG